MGFIEVFILTVACTINIIINQIPSMLLLIILHGIIYQITGFSIYRYAIRSIFK